VLLTICLLLIIGSSITVTLVAHGAIHWLSLQQSRPKRGVVPVSVLRPMKGLDDDLEANLESLCRQDHPQYEILLGAADSADPALVVARKVARNHPELSIRVIAGEWVLGLNPKVRVLRNLIRSARYDAVLISDSNVHAGESYLSATTAELNDPSVGLVSNPIVGVGGTTFGSLVENLLFNTFVLQGVVLANYVGRHACVQGKSMLMRRSALDQAGGLKKFANVLAEDYLIGRAISKAGWRVVTSPIAIQCVCNTRSLSMAWQRHLRWALTRKSLGVMGYVFELILSPNIWLTLAALFAICSPFVHAIRCQTSALVGCALAYAIVCLSEAISVRRWQSGDTSLLVAILQASWRQHLQMSWWLVAWCTNKVTWRGNKLRLGRGSRLMVPRQPLIPVMQRFFRQAA
jgi:ceramide glucosyltransferase